MKSIAPIIYFAYNRPQHTRQTLEALSKNNLAKESVLRIYIDGTKAGSSAETIANIEEVKKIALEKKWCGEVNVIISEKNRGLFKSITEGITKTVNEFGKVIVMEDDVLVSPFFLNFMNDALDLYENTPAVMHISGFSRAEFSAVKVQESTYFFNHTSCWGWATWKRAWDKFTTDSLAVKAAISKKGNIKKLNMDNTFEMFWGLKAIADGKFQSWNTIWHSIVFLYDGFCLHPTKSLVSNIGHDGSGTNCVPDEYFGKNELLDERTIIKAIPVKENMEIRAFNVGLNSYSTRVLFMIKHYLRYLVGY
jgi:Glycosyl transferase family 2